MSNDLRSLLTRAARRAATALRLGAVALLGAMLLTQGQSAALSGHPHPAHWREIASPADLDQAFAQAQREGKPVFLYWEPAGCEPCQHPQAQLFTREDFVLLSRRFVAVHVDGDAPGLQRLAGQLRLPGNPSTLLFSPAREELTRLSGDLDSGQFLSALRSAIGGSATRQAARPLRQVVDDALTGLELPNHEWRQLAHYAWDEAPAPLAEPRERARVLAQLAQACPLQLRASRTRLLVQAVAAAERAGRPIGSLVRDGAERHERHERADRLPEALKRSTALALRRVFDDERSTRELLDLITRRTPVVLASLTELASVDGRQLRTAWDQALQRLANDPGLAAEQRLAALQARLDLALLGQPRPAAELPPPLRDEIRRTAVQLGTATESSSNRSTSTSRAAQLLTRAGLLAESDALLRAQLPNLGGAPEPMAQLADNARARGQFRETLLWSRRAWEAAQGPARRLQWGTQYLRQLTELAPGEATLIDEVANQVLTELTRQPEALPERSAAQLRELTEHLMAWQVMAPDDPGRLDRWRQQLGPACARPLPGSALPSGCDGLVERRLGS